MSGKAKNPHYYKSVKDMDYIDIYEVCRLFNVDDNTGAIHHAIKKLLVSGGRSGGKTKRQDVDEAIQSLQRWVEIMDNNNWNQDQETGNNA